LSDETISLAVAVPDAAQPAVPRVGKETLPDSKPVPGATTWTLVERLAVPDTPIEPEVDKTAPVLPLAATIAATNRVERLRRKAIRSPSP